MNAFALRVSVASTVVCLVAMSAASSALAQCEPGCAPVTWGAPSHLKYSITYKQGVLATETQKQEVEDFVYLAAANWTEDLEKRNNVGSVKKREGEHQTGDVLVRVTDNLSGAQATTTTIRV